MILQVIKMACSNALTFLTIRPFRANKDETAEQKQKYLQNRQHCFFLFIRLNAYIWTF